MILLSMVALSLPYQYVYSKFMIEVLHPTHNTRVAVVYARDTPRIKTALATVSLYRPRDLRRQEFYGYRETIYIPVGGN